MIFNTWGWHIKNDKQYGGVLLNIMTFLHYWRMPLLFLISGAGTYFALGKRTSGQYLGERFKRLIIPFLIGVFTLVPVQVYLEKSSQYTSLLDFYPHMFDGIYPEGNFSWHHLWFIVYLFVIALLISPFLTFFRSSRFSKFTRLVEKIVIKPFALNIVIIPLLLSQIVLRQFFEVDTHDLVSDWASMSFYIIFFMSGFILLPNRIIVEAVRKQKFWYLAEAISVTIIMLKAPQLAGSERTAEIIRDISSIFVAWTCGVTAIGFARQYLNFDSRLRKLANEAIYPFYLLHQPVIVISGYFMVGWDIQVIWKVVFITLTSFTLTTACYWFIIRPVNLFRIIFGMKMVRKENQKQETRYVHQPVIVNVGGSLPVMKQ
jgi:peptidoglycan/LPS O-acetylase OafA/YrhL